MAHKLEITIENEKLWKALCKYSALSQIPVSKLVNDIGMDEIIGRIVKKIIGYSIKNDPLVKKILLSEPEIKDFLDGQ